MLTDLLQMAGVESFQQLVSKALSLVIMVGALGLQVPQILVCYRSKSVAGLSATSLYSTVCIPLTFSLYSFMAGNPLEIWAENLFTLTQNIILVILYWTYAKPKVSASSKMIVCAVFGAIVAICLGLPEEYRYLIPLTGVPFLVMARIPQLYTNFVNGSTGTLSPIPLFLVTGGAAARIFTTITSVGYDWSVIGTYMLSSTLAFTTLLQIIYYKYVAERGGRSSSSSSGGSQPTRRSPRLKKR